MAKKNKASASDAQPALDGEAVLERLREIGVPVTADELASRIKASKRARPAFEAAIESLVRAGDVLVNRKGELLVAEKLDLVRGTMQGHPDGYGHADSTTADDRDTDRNSGDSDRDVHQHA